MAIIEVAGLTKRFGPVVAVDQIGFKVGAGRVTGFLGPNGAGKTTTLRMLLGLVKPTAGTAIIHGRPYAALPDPSRQVGAVLEATGFHPGRTARNHLRIRAMASRVPAGRVDAVLEMTGLTGAAGRRIGGFSLGMRQRLGLASAMLGDPAVLVLDEPANGLDPEGVRWLREFLRGLAAEGRTVLVSSHLLAEVAQIAADVIILDHGRLIVHAPLAELMTDANRTVLVRSPRAAELRDALGADGARVAMTQDGQLEIHGVTAEWVGELAAARAIPISESVTRTAGLEDVFFQLTAKDATTQGER